MPPKQRAASDNGVYQFPSITASSWGKTVLFYPISYVVLCALFATCMTTCHATADKDTPTYSNANGLIGENPGLEFRPLIDVADGDLIKYNSSDPKSRQKYIDLMNEFFENTLGKVSNFAPECTFEHIPSNGIACPVDITRFGDCNPPFYGYDKRKSPCVFLKLNKIYDWVPTYYNDSKDLHVDMPSSLVRHIEEAQKRNESNQVWVSCEGEYPSDREHVVHFNYFPGHGFPGYFYPYQHGMDEYLSPIVAVQIMLPNAYTPLIVECRAWAKNIKFEGGPAELRKGSTRFQILRNE